MTYSSAHIEFRCAVYSILDIKKNPKLNLRLAKKKVSDLQKYSKMLDTQLVVWKKSVDAAREKYYELNYFTTRQLLELRRELGQLLHSATIVSSVKPSVLMLLENVSPEVSSSVVLESLQVTHFAQQPTLTDEVLTTKNTCSKSSSRCKVTASSASTFQKTLTKSSFSGKLELFSDKQQEDFRYLTETLDYSISHVLKAFEECGQDANLYDIEEWCENNEECILTDGEMTSDNEDKFEYFDRTESGKILITALVSLGQMCLFMQRW